MPLTSENHAIEAGQHTHRRMAVGEALQDALDTLELEPPTGSGPLEEGPTPSPSTLSGATSGSGSKKQRPFGVWIWGGLGIVGFGLVVLLGILWWGAPPPPQKLKSTMVSSSHGNHLGNASPSTSSGKVEPPLTLERHPGWWGRTTFRWSPPSHRATFRVALYDKTRSLPVTCVNTTTRKTKTGMHYCPLHSAEVEFQESFLNSLSPQKNYVLVIQEFPPGGTLQRTFQQTLKGHVLQGR